MTEKSCYVYLFYYPDISTKNPNKSNAVKIGISGNPKSRLKNLNHSYPGEILIEYIKKFETRAEATNAERFLHNFFNKDRAKYEFFYLNIDDCKKKIIEKFGEGDDINKLENQNKNKTFRVPSYMKLAEENKIDKPAEYSQKSKYENFFNSLNDKVSPFRSDPSVNINMREVLRKKARERNIHLYDRIQNPLSGLYYDKPYSFGFKIDEVLNSFYEEHPMVKNEYFSEFLVTVSDHMGWELREAKDYEEKNSKFWGHVVGSGDREKEFRSRNFKIS